MRRRCTNREAPYLVKFLSSKVKHWGNIFLLILAFVIGLITLAMVYTSFVFFIGGFWVWTAYLLGAVGFGFIDFKVFFQAVHSFNETFEAKRKINALDFYIDEGHIVDKYYNIEHDHREYPDGTYKKVSYCEYYIKFGFQDGSCKSYELNKKEWKEAKRSMVAWRIELNDKYYLIFGRRLEEILNSTQ